MVTHIVLFRPKVELTLEEKARLLVEIETFQSRPFVRDATVGPIIRTAGLAMDSAPVKYSHAIVMRFESLADLIERFIPDPEHQAFARWFQQRVDFASYGVEHGSTG